MQQHRTEKGFFDYDRSIVALLNEETEDGVRSKIAYLKLRKSFCSRLRAESIIMAALWNGAGHYIFALWFLSFLLLSCFFLA